MKAVLVTGGNTGIGFALCKQLLVEHGCKVFMTGRSMEKLQTALKELEDIGPKKDNCTLIQLDVSSDQSVATAKTVLSQALGNDKLYGLVNNAGVGLVTDTGSADGILNTNFFGLKRVSEAFIPFLDPTCGRIVNLGSGAAGNYVSKLGETDDARMMIKDDITLDEILDFVEKKKDGAPMGGYGLSKAAVAQYTKIQARENPSLTISCCSPGFIATNMTAGYNATKSPAEGTVAIKKLLFEKLEGNGWYYGSDGVRSPYHFMRNPGEPPYDGQMPF